MIKKSIQMKIQHQGVDIILSQDPDTEGYSIQFLMPDLPSDKGKVKCDLADLVAMGEMFHDFVNMMHAAEEGR